MKEEINYNAICEHFVNISPTLTFEYIDSSRIDGLPIFKITHDPKNYKTTGNFIHR